MRTISALVLFCVAFSASVAFAQDTSKIGPNEPPAAEHRPANLQVWDGFWHSKINYRYHLIEGAYWGIWDRVSRVAVVILAIVSMVGPFVYEKTKVWKSIWYSVGAVSLLFTVIPFIWPFPEWSSEDTILAGRWNEMAGEWYTLYEEVPNLSASEITERISALRKAVAAIENSETSARYNPKTMIAAEDAEREFQGIKNDGESSKSASKPKEESLSLHNSRRFQ